MCVHLHDRFGSISETRHRWKWPDERHLYHTCVPRIHVRALNKHSSTPRKIKALQNTSRTARKTANMENTPPVGPSTASLRWAILRRAFISPRLSSSRSDRISQMDIKSISRKAACGFNLIPCHVLNGPAIEETSLKVKDLDGHRDACMCYVLPMGRTTRLVLIQRGENHVNLNDFEICSIYDIDNTGLVCRWPSEDVLAYFCLTHADMFRSKRVLELGSGYGLAGLTIATNTDAVEVVISDGNPQVVDYIQRSIHANTELFGHTEVKPMTLHWNQGQVSQMLNTFDIIVASDWHTHQCVKDSSFSSVGTIK
ncbi:calmodulin-lysine N-methyltransferase isoform X2 [Magnolia sinica]|uniref:calmodulin-lysine N-methyltransferase isoform X2 n=1 Tax=Magnolia sinica TaxID=86752 RepID=UPI0026586699|nr:calmodulin-lysine N-methyltransferase isoform X2 [Magnolia sinica]